MVYVDTSVLIKLYIKEDLSREASNRIKKNNEAVPLTRFHELEFTNAIQLKQFRSEITEDETLRIMTKFKEHENKGIYYRPQLDWSEIFNYSVDLSKKHTATIGARSLDILHVASALSIKAEKFLTVDGRQSELATRAGLKIVEIILV
jgi:predicted nucleic acid-binding protein